MSDYLACSRTNYFKVTDKNKYDELFKSLVSSSEIEDFSKEIDGVLHCCFGCYGWIDYEDPETHDFIFDNFINELQKILPDGEIFIYMESGHEKLKYVTGVVIICTNKEVKTLSLQEWAIEQAKLLVGRDIFDTLNY